jgi:hypothetical protein
MVKVAKRKKSRGDGGATTKKGTAQPPAAFDPVEWLIRTHPATASWLGHDLTKDRRKR